MALFGRRRKAPSRYDDALAGNPRARVSTQHVNPAPGGSRANIQGTVTGWRPMPGSQNPSQQIGAFDGQLLNQYPALVPGVQLHCGREWGNSRWYYPVVGGAESNDTQTPRPQMISGGQRFGSIYSGPIGPIAAQQLKQNVAYQQVRQSGMAALDWAAALQDQ